MGFESDQPEKPYVLGTHYSGKEKSGYYTAENDIKAIHTRSGTKIILNDAEGSVFIEDPSGNTYLMDGQGNIKVNAPKNIEIAAGENMDVNVGKNLTFNVAEQAILNIMQKMLITTPYMKQLVADFYHTQAGKALINSSNEIKLESPETYVAGQRKLFLHSDETATLNSKGIAELKGETKNSFSNVADSHEPTKEEIETKVLVHFRPKKGWKGEDYGMDWWRTGDLRIFEKRIVWGDMWYEEIVGEIYSDTTYKELVSNANAQGGVLKISPKMISQLKTEYEVKLVPSMTKKDELGRPKTDQEGKAVYAESFTTWLTLYPRDQGYTKNTKAELRLLVDIEAEADTLRFIENEHFTITPPEISLKGLEKKTHPLAQTITIECLSEFDKDQEIIAEAVKINEDGKETLSTAGRLKIWANGKENRITYNQVLLVQVKTPPISHPTNKLSGDASQYTERLKEVFRQLYIECEPEVIKLDVSGDTNFKSRFTRGVYMNGNISISRYLKTQLDEELKKQGKTPTYYENYILCFLLGESEGEPESSSYGFNIKSTNRIVLYRHATPSTLPHEILHALGLYHVFNNKKHHSNALYTYKLGTTDNIMDYHSYDNEFKYSLWKWQWQLAQQSINTKKK